MFYCSTNSKSFIMAEENISMALSPGQPLSGQRVRRISPCHNDVRSTDYDDTFTDFDQITNTNNKIETQKLKIFNNIVRITTWNVKSLRINGKLENVEAEMKRLNIDILGMSEVRWPGTGTKKNADSFIYYSGGSDANNYYGVAVLLRPNIQKSVIDFIPISDRVMMLKLNTNFRTLNLIQVYAPTCDKPDEDVEVFLL
uniref:Craniofacial development protein 2 n=1 Tax=Cacopsylla melanoneura TaxID=428564 RepID=A0A8D8SJB6_9HEMI